MLYLLNSGEFSESESENELALEESESTSVVYLMELFESELI